MSSFDKVSESLIPVQELSNVDGQAYVTIGSMYPDHAQDADDYLYDYDLPKVLKMKWVAYAYVSEGTAVPNANNFCHMGSITFCVEFPDQEIEIKYSRTNVVTGITEILVVKKMFSNIMVATEELSTRKADKGKFIGGMSPQCYNGDDNTVWFQYE